MEFEPLIQLCETLENTSKRSEKTYYIAQFLQQITQKEDIRAAIVFLQGRLFSHGESKNLGVSTKLVLKAMHIATGYTQREILTLWQELGDLGFVGEKLCSQKKQATLFAQTLTLTEIYDNLLKLATLSGDNSTDYKIKLIAELLTKTSGLEAKYIIRFILEVMRLGVGMGTLRDALCWAFMPKMNYLFAYDTKSNTFVPTTLGFSLTPTTTEQKALETESKTVPLEELSSKTFTKTLYENQPIHTIQSDIIICPDQQSARELYTQYCAIIQKALDTTNDTVLVSELCFAKDVAQLIQTKPILFTPIQVMLAQKVETTTQALEKIPAPCFAEYKYDGFRVQIHKQGTKVALYTRRMENVSEQFPDVLQAVQKHIKAESGIFDAEIVGFSPKTKKYTAFQEISQRIRRKYDIHTIQKEFPVEVNVFDCLLLEDTILLDEPFKNRREKLNETLTSKPFVLSISQGKSIKTIQDLDSFYAKSLQQGNEGVMIKTLQATYTPGSRVGHMIKLKPIMETIDVVITSATWGEGKRSSWFTSFGVSCLNNENQLVEVGRVGTGFKEDESECSFSHLTKLLEEHIISQKEKTVTVKPFIVLELSFEEIQKSQNYSSGYALRFPRVVRLREKGVDNTTTLEQLHQAYAQQRGRNEE